MTQRGDDCLHAKNARQATELLKDESIEAVAFEKLPDALDKLFDRWGVENHLGGRTPVHPLMDFFTPTTLQIVNKLYRQDFVRLGYPILDRLDP